MLRNYLVNACSSFRPRATPLLVLEAVTSNNLFFNIHIYNSRKISSKSAEKCGLSDNFNVRRSCTD
uniref:Uncharacterized protein n=1 Tax=Lepeophtheirus salmonis TaxID=72036 RepID=A0A0K2TG47_LEPSM